MSDDAAVRDTDFERFSRSLTTAADVGLDGSACLLLGEAIFFPLFAGPVFVMPLMALLALSVLPFRVLFFRVVVMANLRGVGVQRGPPNTGGAHANPEAAAMRARCGAEIKAIPAEFLESD